MSSSREGRAPVKDEERARCTRVRRAEKKKNSRERQRTVTLVWLWIPCYE
uniref:Uncharacterized protein n=1 Tax=Arundo donax TaxID=35708 RepID=A0A0A8ZTB9_ARUDO